jgi:hypothetical protein
VQVPTRLHIAQLREEFMDFCDSLNLDAILEPAATDVAFAGARVRQQSLWPCRVIQIGGTDIWTVEVCFRPRKIVVNGPVSIATGNYEESGPRSGRKTAASAAAGTLVGRLAQA